jgi:two-component system CheB/CheR fusion protein
MKKNNPPRSPKFTSQEQTENDSETELVPALMPSTPPASFPIIGIGASAGGLEALELFIKNIKPQSGMAYVIIQHLDPTHEGILVQLLQRATALPVIQVEDKLTIQSNCIYVIPPNKDMSVLHGTLHLLPPTAPRGLRLPIDYFFRSLAADQQEKGVGVILSGMGSDGTLGIRAIKEKNGAVFVQTPSSAKFDGMPQSAINTGLVDVIAPVEELPNKIQTYFQQAPLLPQFEMLLENKSQSALEKIFILLRSHTGHDFSLYKKNTIYRRVERRMRLHQIDQISTYVRFLQENPHETELLFKELLIGVTSFFRDPLAWDQLKTEVLPAIIAEHPAGGVIRAWTAGCSTGEEAYSLAIIIKEALEQIKPEANFSFQIFATDLDQEAIEKARQGVFPENISADVSSERLRRFFVQEEHHYRVNKEIREMVIFARQNLVTDAPFTKLDLLICRNLLIYLAVELQKKLLPLFHYSLKPGGYLFLGSAETIGGFTELFLPLENKNRIFRRLSATPRPELVDFPSAFFPSGSGMTGFNQYQSKEAIPVPNIQNIVEQQILQNFAPAAVMINDKGDIIYISGRTGKYLEPAAGKANLNIFAMARDGLRYELTNAFQKILHEKTPVTLNNLMVNTEGGMQALDLIIQPLTEFEGLQNVFLIIFKDIITQPPTSIDKKKRRFTTNDKRVEQLEKELLRSHEDLQSSREEMQTSQEELKSTNEELQSTNEELQSTNEELTTSKEEMQSLNEELQTVNHELQARVDDLSRSNNDMKNLLNSTDIATLFLDDRLLIRRFTNQASKIIKLITSDIGRPITDIASDLLYPELEEDVFEVLRTLAFKETQVSTRNGRWFTVKIMPYRTLENRIDGVVITFVDISIAKNLEMTMRENEKEMKALFNFMPVAFALFETDFDSGGNLINCSFIYVNKAFEQLMDIKAANVQGKTIYDIWPEIELKWLEILEPVALNREPVSFVLEQNPNQKRFRCNVYRPDEKFDRLCIIFEVIN